MERPQSSGSLYHAEALVAPQICEGDLEGIAVLLKGNRAETYPETYAGRTGHPGTASLPQWATEGGRILAIGGAVSALAGPLRSGWMRGADLPVRLGAILDHGHAPGRLVGFTVRPQRPYPGILYTDPPLVNAIMRADQHAPEGENQ